MENVSFVIPLSTPILWFTFVMSAIMEVLKDDVLFVATLELLMPTIVENVFNSARIGRVVRKLSI
jgi:hypothetical protein